MKVRTKKMIYSALGGVFLAVGSWITVPFAIPFTMQTFALFFVLMVFGGRVGATSVFLHIALGIVGLPVFAGFKSGVSALLGPAGGYIMGFAIVGALYFALDSILSKNIIVGRVFPFVCLGLVYGFGTAWYMLYISAESEIGLASALAACVAPYILPDVVKICLAEVMAVKFKKFVSN